MKLKKLVPFFIIFVLVVYLAERQQNSPLPAPDLELLAVDLREAEGLGFVLTDLSGQTLGTEDLRGRVLLLNFFETWCPPCRDEMPTIEALYQKYKEEGLTVIGVAGDKQGQKIVEPFVKDFKMSFPVLLDSSHRVTNQYTVRGIPAVFLIDRRGRLAGKVVGGSDWSSDRAYAIIEKLLQETS